MAGVYDDTTLSDIVGRLRRRLVWPVHEETDQLGANVGANATSLSLTSGNSLGTISAGAIIEVGFEDYLVTATPSSASAISVSPGYWGTTSTNHTAGAPLYVNPHFLVGDMITAVNEELDSLSSPEKGLFQAAELVLTYNPVIEGYDMTDANTNIAVTSTGFLDLLEVRVHEYGPFQWWPRVPLSKIEIERQADTTVFPSGMALHFKGIGYPGRPIRIQYKAPFNSTLSASTDNITSVTGLPASANDILVLGAAIRMMSFREVPRAFTEAQPQPRRAQEVPVGAALTSIKGMQMLYDNRVAEERDRLGRMWPMRFR